MLPQWLLLAAAGVLSCPGILGILIRYLNLFTTNFRYCMNILNADCLIFFFVWRCKVVEIDFLYPSEGIHRRWENGYRITSMAATSDQAAFILSIPKRKLLDETQETLRTSAFPSTHVKVISSYINFMFGICAVLACMLVFANPFRFDYLLI